MIQALICESGTDIRGEQRMSRARRRAEFRMELAADEPRVTGQLDQFGQRLGLGARADPQPSRFDPRDVVIVDFVPVPMALVDRRTAIDFLDQRTRNEVGWL